MKVDVRALRQRLERHKERYIRAYCLRFNIGADDLRDHELVIREEWAGAILKTHVYMQRREEP